MIREYRDDAAPEDPFVRPGERLLPLPLQRRPVRRRRGEREEEGDGDEDPGERDIVSPESARRPEECPRSRPKKMAGPRRPVDEAHPRPRAQPGAAEPLKRRGEQRSPAGPGPDHGEGSTGGP